MSIKATMLSVAALAIAGGIVAGILLNQSPPAQPPAPESKRVVKEAVAEPPPTPPVPEVAKSETITPLVDTGPVVEPASAENPPNVKPVQNNPPASNPGKKPKQLMDPVAREALGLVGIDREAEAYWLEAIYDTRLPDNEREDLIEDLNEDGLSDPKNPGLEDLQLIINRLALIEAIVPHADGFMLRHLGEAYKDLINLAQRTQGGGRPAQ